MDHQSQRTHVGNSILQNPTHKVKGGYVPLLDEQFYRIRHYDRMPPFFMSIVSSTDHWMFISSTGGLSAGRSSAETALFPYYTDDRISENNDNTGHVAILRVTREMQTSLWEPFSTRYTGLYNLERNLYKNDLSDKLVFEETNHDLGLTYRYAWRTSDRYGLVKTSWLINDTAEIYHVTLVDGMQNLLPRGTTTAIQNTFSNLLNAYKRNELDSETGLGIFSLSSTLTDLAEPNESLKTTTVWQVGLEQARTLLSSTQLEDFRRGQEIIQETDIRGRRGAYITNASFDLQAGEQKEWSFVAELNQDSVNIAALINALKTPAELKIKLEEDIARGSANLTTIVASADGLQLSGDQSVTAHHSSNVLFNTMRGGIFANNYQVQKEDLFDFVATRSKVVAHQQADFFASLPDMLDSSALIGKARLTGSSDLERLCYEYLPLTFGRRHGDPSRPWNRFSINLKKPDGSQKLDYQGNWRDIFQNWEPLAWSYPEFTEQLICKFLNATTVDGYNPYRVTRDGIEWEIPAPNDPWANIGYWGDHQIIYLEKLLEISAKFHPGQLQALLNRKIFSFANVPYRIKEYTWLFKDWYNTISFDWDLDEKINADVKDLGMDGKLVRAAGGQIFHVSMAEKLLSLLLAKLGNFVPEGGIWMNTQRPEWNDGNNALVGKGLSVVTAAYLRRFLAFFRNLLSETDTDNLSVTREVKSLFESIQATLQKHKTLLQTFFSDDQRRHMMDELGQASSDFRWNYYRNGLSGESSEIDKGRIVAFLDLAQGYIEHTLKANARPDHLYHAYNVLHLSNGKASIGHLYEMLEGQVAILSSGMLAGEQSLALLHNLRESKMYRPDQHSYMLYPNRDLPGFLQKNCLSAAQVEGSALIAELVRQGDHSLIATDANGVYHFNGDFRNAGDVKRTLDRLKLREPFTDLVKTEGAKILDMFETVFDHHSFTGRSGTFFAYEGLGSIYWHMVSKLLLAAQETTLRATENGEAQEVVHALAEAYYDIRRGLGFNKSPEVYGAFPTDPYSHTPAGQGAKQPGMSGQVKEEILARFSELGITVEDGIISFEPLLLDAKEYLDHPSPFQYVAVIGQRQTIDLPAGSLAFTFCQVPVVYRSGSETKVEVHFSNGRAREVNGYALDIDISQHIFRRDGQVVQVTVYRPV
ncbi:MAG: hypothetical protein ABIF04_06905 [Chloroflexota bacterium]